MRNRLLWSAVLCACPLLLLTSCSTDPSLTSIVINPGSFTAVLAPCGDPQVSSNFTATGYYTHPGHAAVTKDITSQVTWASLTPEMVTISTTGTATVTCQMYGSTEISASAPGFHGDIVGYAAVNVTQPNSATNSNITSMSITPQNPSIPAGNTEAFVAIGTTGNGSQQNITSSSAWTSSSPGVATISGGTGVATGVSAGSTIIVATYTNPDGTQATATTTLTVQ